jgi:hypothetical protein
MCVHVMKPHTTNNCITDINNTNTEMTLEHTSPLILAWQGTSGENNDPELAAGFLHGPAHHGNK